MSTHSFAAVKSLSGKITCKGAEINYATLNSVGWGAPFCSVLSTRDKEFLGSDGKGKATAGTTVPQRNAQIEI